MSEITEIKLLGIPPSPFVNRIQFVLNLKSINYEFMEDNLENKSELLLASNPYLKKVPVLLHGNKSPICESLIIIEYLEEIKPHVHKIIPSDPSDRAAVRFWAYYIDHEFFPLYGRMRKSPKEGKEAIKQQIVEQSSVLEEAFVKCSNGKAYFGGDDLGYLDVVLGCFLGWTRFYEKLEDFKVFDEVRTPGLVGWVKRMWLHEAIKDDIPRQETLMNFYMVLQKIRPPRTTC